MRLALGAAIAMALPVSAVAQAEKPTPEGTTWYLVSYVLDGELTQVPWYVDATLLLDDSQAVGSTGCNSLLGSYSLAGDALTFTSIGTASEMGCGETWMGTEVGYMAALPAVAAWATDSSPFDRALNLYDEAGDIVLTYQQSAVNLTPADVNALASELDALRARIEKLERQIKRG